MSTLVIIDLQNDFLAPTAPFKVDPKSQASLRKTLEILVPAFRDSGGQIIWVKSYYAFSKAQAPRTIVPITEAQPAAAPHANPSSTESGASMVSTVSISEPSSASEKGDDWPGWVVEGTHTGKKPCCQEGTYGADLVWWSDPLRCPGDAVVIKTHFSAFKDSQLEQVLMEQCVNTIYFAGLLSNMCVLATSLSAIRIAPQNGRAWETCVVTDALAWRREESHRRALETLESYGVNLVGSERFTKTQAVADITCDNVVWDNYATFER